MGGRTLLALAGLVLIGCHRAPTFLGDFTTANPGYEEGLDYYTFKSDGTYTMATSSKDKGKFCIETGTFKVAADVLEVVSMEQQFLDKDGKVTSRYRAYYGRPILDKKYQFTVKDDSFVLKPQFDTDQKEMVLTKKK